MSAWFQKEKDELSLIYEENFKKVDDNTVSIFISTQGKSCTIIYKIPLEYPEQIPEISVEIEGYSGANISDYLKKIAEGLTGLSMIAYLTSQAIDFLEGIPEKQFQGARVHVTQTRFTREAFLLWYDKFVNEQKKQEDPNLPPNGRQMFEQGLVS